MHFFHPGEADYQRRWGLFRQEMLRPILRMLAAFRVHPDVVTLLGVLSMTLLPAGFLYGKPDFVIAAYAGHIICDALDGPLARHRKLTSAAGAYTDVIADHWSLVATTMTLLWFGIGDPFWLSVYTISYVLVIVHLVLLNVHESPMRVPVIRTRYPLCVLVILLAYGWNVLPILDPFLRIAGVYYVLMLLITILSFRWSLNSQD